MIPFLVGLMLIAITVALHATATSIIASLLGNYGMGLHARFDRKARPFILGGTAVCLAIKHYLDVILWALTYWHLAGSEELASFEDAMYLSSVTYTSLGYGDITLSSSWRLVCGMQAMNGILLFGWSTAILFFLVTRFWADHVKEFPNSSEQDNQAN